MSLIGQIPVVDTSKQDLVNLYKGGLNKIIPQMLLIFNPKNNHLEGILQDGSIVEFKVEGGPNVIGLVKR